MGVGRKASWIWKSIVKSRSALHEGMCYALGDGNSIHIWRDPWVPSLPRFLPVAREDSDPLLNVITVRDLLLEDGRRYSLGIQLMLLLNYELWRKV